MWGKTKLEDTVPGYRHYLDNCQLQPCADSAEAQSAIKELEDADRRGYQKSVGKQTARALEEYLKQCKSSGCTGKAGAQQILTKAKRLKQQFQSRLDRYELQSPAQANAAQSREAFAKLLPRDEWLKEADREIATAYLTLAKSSRQAIRKKLWAMWRRGLSLPG